MYKCMYIIYYLDVLMAYHRTPHKLRLGVVFHMHGVFLLVYPAAQTDAGYKTHIKRS